MSSGQRKAAAAKAPFHVTVFAARWKVFAVYQPLAVNIHRQVMAAAAPGIAAGKITKAELHAALACYCRHPAYLKACKAGAVRIDLNGKPAGTVTRKEADYARGVLAARKAAKRAAKSPNATASKEKARAAVCATNNVGPKGLRHERYETSH
jgi:sRNA-binding protein